jgi:hypothetical protein
MSETPAKRIFSFSDAAALLPEVRAITAEAHDAVEALRSAAGEPSADRKSLDARAQEVVQAWTRAMNERGIDVKGLWLIDFDNGSGYYCWRYPEERLEYFHSYEEGFGGRIRIH